MPAAKFLIFAKSAVGILLDSSKTNAKSIFFPTHSGSGGLVTGPGVGAGVGLGVGAGVGLGVGAGVGLGVGAGVGLGVGAGVGLGVGAGVGLGVGAGVGLGGTGHVDSAIDFAIPTSLSKSVTVNTCLEAGAVAIAVSSCLSIFPTPTAMIVMPFARACAAA